MFALLMSEHVSKILNTYPLLQLDNICWQAPSRPVLNQISCVIEQGSFTGVLGPNGAGKSSLLRCLYRYITPSAGTVRYLGEDIQCFSSQDYAKLVAVVLQHTPQDFQLNVFDVVALGLIPHKPWLSGLSKEEKRLVMTAIKQVGLTNKQSHNFETLSGGEKQRVMIARAIVQQPKILIMDEPTSHLDVKYQIQIMELAKSLEITVIASFHDLNLAAAICDNLLLLKNGELVASGAPDKVITEQQLSSVFDVCTRVTTHPQNNAPLITYFYGYPGLNKADDDERRLSRDTKGDHHDEF